MSAFMVSEDTLDLLASVAQWGKQYEQGLNVRVSDDTLPPRSAIERKERGRGYFIEHANTEARYIKEELRLENMASLWARYPDDASEMWGEEMPDFRYVSTGEATLQQALGALLCYMYQACETETWEKSYAFALCQGIKEKLIRLISDGCWEYDREGVSA